MISILLFVALLGYLAVILEAPIRINKTITAILTGALCWVVLAVFNEGNPHEVSEKLIAYFGEISGLLIMAIVGGAIIPPIMGVLNSNFSIYWALYLLVLCFVYVLLLALKNRHILKN